MNKTTAMLIVLCWLFIPEQGFAQKKMTYGVGVDIFQTKLNNVDRENFSGYGHSMPGFTQNDQLGFGATFLAQTPIYKNLSFETGLGITNFNSQFHFNYIRKNTNDSVNTKLNISLFYAKLPIYLTYNLQLNTQSAINFSLGADLRFLFLWQDNYQEIIWEFINLPTGRYSFIIPSFKAVVGYNFQLLNSNNIIRFEAFFGQDLLKFTFGGNHPLLGWGFYKNLSRASYQYYGISLKYFFTK